MQKIASKASTAITSLPFILAGILALAACDQKPQTNAQAWETISEAQHASREPNAIDRLSAQDDPWQGVDAMLAKNEAIRAKAEAADDGWIGNVKQAAATLAGD